MLFYRTIDKYILPLIKGRTVLRYLAGETEDMIETVEKKDTDKKLEVVITKDEEEEVVDGELVEDDEVEEEVDILLEVSPDFVDDVGHVVAEVLLKNQMGDGVFTEDRMTYITEEVITSIKQAFEYMDFTEETYQYWYETVFQLGMDAQVG